jgi:acetolactate synthase-1/2/3 large subunit
MLALGVRFDDRVTGKLEAFATRSRIVHIDIDPAEIHKNKHAHIPICAGRRVMHVGRGVASWGASQAKWF